MPDPDLEEWVAVPDADLAAWDGEDLDKQESPQDAVEEEWAVLEAELEEAEVAIRRVNKLLQGLSMISMVSKPQLSKRMLVSQKAGAGGVGAEANEVDGLCLTCREAAEVAGVTEEVNLALVKDQIEEVATRAAKGNEITTKRVVLGALRTSSSIYSRKIS